MVWTVLNSAQESALREIVTIKSDRISAILGGAMLDDSLRRAIESQLRHDKDMNEKLFRVSGPLGNTGPKIDLGYQLSLFDKPIRNAMYGISEIRNLFAHNLEMSFALGGKRIDDAFAKMKLHLEIENYPLRSLPSGETEKYKIEPVTPNSQSHLIVNLKLCLMWLTGTVYPGLQGPVQPLPSSLDKPPQPNMPPPS